MKYKERKTHLASPAYVCVCGKSTLPLLAILWLCAVCKLPYDVSYSMLILVNGIGIVQNNQISSTLVIDVCH